MAQRFWMSKPHNHLVLSSGVINSHVTYHFKWLSNLFSSSQSLIHACFTKILSVIYDFSFLAELWKIQVNKLIRCASEKQWPEVYNLQMSDSRKHDFCWSLRNPLRQGTCTSMFCRSDGTLNWGLFWLYMHSIWLQLKDPGTPPKITLEIDEKLDIQLVRRWTDLTLSPLVSSPLR